MLKTRIIPTLLTRGRELVKGERFQSWRRVGNAMQAVRVHNMRGVDELCLLEVGGGSIDIETVKTLASECFMPLTVGGGVHTLEQFAALIKNGADKVVIRRWGVMRAAANKFGSQAVVVCINSDDSGVDPCAQASMAQAFGAGEILLQSVERDGTMRGYDLELIARVSQAVSIPVIASSGCGTYKHMAEAIDAGANAVAAGAMFQFTDLTPQGAALWLHEHGYHTRLAA